MIDRKRWTEILSRFIDVLKINIFIVDAFGSIVLPPAAGKYGGRFLTDPSFCFDLWCGRTDYIPKFEQYGQYLELIDRFDLRFFAIPISFSIILIILFIKTPSCLQYLKYFPHTFCKFSTTILAFFFFYFVFYLFVNFFRYFFYSFN